MVPQRGTRGDLSRERASLARCVGEIDRFFADHWDRSPLLWDPQESFDDLASLGDLDRLIASSGLHASYLRMVRGGKTLPVAAYTKPPPNRSRGTERLVDAPSVYAAYADGATIVIESLHRYWPPLTRFCRDLELALGHRLQVNAYITPPGSQGFDVHRDTHDVFVLQVSGTKHWIVYDRTDDERVLIDQEIRPGTVLYIPTGFPHAAKTAAGASAHLTVGILTHDGRDVVREILSGAEDEPVFQQRFDAGGDPARLRAVVQDQLDALRAWLEKVDVDDVTERIARKVFSTSQPIFVGQLRQLALLDGMHAGTRLRRREGTICVLFPGAARLKVLLADRELEMPLAVAGAMRVLADRAEVKVSDLEPHLTLESALVLTRRLVREGLLEVVVDD